MSIEDRIRTGLTANAEVPAPPVERHLDIVRRRHRRRVGVKVAVVLAGVAVAAAAPWVVLASLGDRSQQPATPEEPPVPGTFRVEVQSSGETRTMTGAWTVTLEAGGGIAIEPPASYDGPAVDGETWEVTGDRFTTNLFIGWPGCQRADPPVGLHRVTANDTGLRFARVSDTCAPRIVLFALPWERQP